MDFLSKALERNRLTKEGIEKLIPKIPFSKEQLMRVGPEHPSNLRYYEMRLDIPPEVFDAITTLHNFMIKENLNELAYFKLRNA